MERSVTRTTQWVAFVALVSPVTFCLAETATPPCESSCSDIQAADPVIAVGSEPMEVASQDLPRFKHVSYPAAWSAAQETNRPILVYVSMPQCPHCSQMLRQTFEQPEVDELVKGSFETLQVGRYTHATLISKLHVRWYPTTVLVGSNNKVLDMIEGYVDANTFKRRLQLGIASAGTDTQTR